MIIYWPETEHMHNNNGPVNRQITVNLNILSVVFHLRSLTFICIKTDYFKISSNSRLSQVKTLANCVLAERKAQNGEL